MPSYKITTILASIFTTTYMSLLFKLVEIAM